MMMRTFLRLGLALSMFALVGCGGDEAVTTDDMPSPSEGAQTVNENPSTTTVDVPTTPIDESELDDENPPSPAEAAAEGTDPAEDPEN